MYTNYAIIKDEQVVEYPVDPNLTHKIPDFWLGGELDGKQYVFCHMGVYSYDHETQYLAEGTPVFNNENGNWYRSFTAENYSGEALQNRIAELTQIAQNTIAASCARADVCIQNMQLPVEQRDAWSAYKVAVENVLNQENAPFRLTWPQEPNSLFQAPTAVVEP